MFFRWLKNKITVGWRSFVSWVQGLWSVHPEQSLAAAREASFSTHASSEETPSDVREPTAPTNISDEQPTPSSSTSRIDKPGFPFGQTLFGGLPRELMNKILSELSFRPPALVIIQDKATQEQKDAVIAGKAYHVIRAVDDQGDVAYSLGFAKKVKKKITATATATDRSNKDSKEPEFTYSYETAPLDKASVFYHVATRTPKRLTSMADASAPRDTYGFYFLEEVIRKVGGFVNFLQDRICFSWVCRDLREWMNPSQKYYSIEFDKTIRQEQVEMALRYVLFGNQKMVEKLVKADPSLLLEKNTVPVKDISGKPVIGKTLLQAALCAGDVANTPGEIAMAEMLTGYLDALPNGSKEREDQVEKIFPEGVDAHVVAQKAKAETFKDEILTPLIDAIIAATDNQVQEMLTDKQPDSPLRQPFDRFRKEIERLSFEDEVFNPYYLLKAFELYQTRFNEFGPQAQWSKRDLWCVQGVGFIQRFLPACYHQAFTQNIYDIVENKARLQREFKFKHSTWVAGAYLELSPSDSYVGLGYEYWLGGTWRREALVVGLGASSAWGRLFKDFVKQKQAVLSNLRGAPCAQKLEQFCRFM